MLDSSGSEAADSEGRLVNVEDRGCSDASEDDVIVAVAATELLDGNSVAVAATELLDGNSVAVAATELLDGSSVVVAATELLDGNSVRLRLAVALADLGLLSVDVVEEVVAFDSVGTGTTGTTNELDAAAENNPWLD